MSLFHRMWTILQSKMSSIMNRAEDPGETLDYSYERQIELLQNVQRGLVTLVAGKRQIQLQDDRLQASAAHLQDEAKQALSVNREDLARLALQRKVALEQQIQGMDAQIAQLDAQQQKLTDAEERLQTKIESFRATKESIKAQYSAAQAQVKIGEAATGISEELADVGLTVQRAQDKTDQLQSRAAAIDDLVSSGALTDLSSGQDDIEQKLAQIGAPGEVDRQLTALKAEVGASSQPKLTGAQQ